MQPPPPPPQAHLSTGRQLLPDNLPLGTIKQYLCNCRRRCGGVLRQIHKKTFNRHRPDRTTPDDQLVLYVSPNTGVPVIGLAAQPLRSIAGMHGVQPASLGASTQTVPYSPHAPQVGSSRATAQAVSRPPQRYAHADDSSTDSDRSSESSEVEDPRHGHGAPPAATLRSPPGRFNDAFSPPAGASSPSLTHRSPASHSPPAQASHEDEDEESSEGGERRTDEPEVGYTEEQGAPRDAHRKEFRLAQDFIDALASATLERSGIDEDTLARLLNPQLQVPEITRSQRAGIRMYLARGDASEDNYTDVRHAMMEYLEGDRSTDSIPTYEQVKKLVGHLTGITTVKTDMCPNSCIAYTGPFENLLECPYCREPRYEPIALDRTKRVARRTFLTFPLGPQLQSLWASPETARAMRHRVQATDRVLQQLGDHPPNAPGSAFAAYDDLYYGADYLNAVNSGVIGRDDMVLMFSIDGAQLYTSKQSDCWFYIWVLLDLSPTLRYKKRYILPGAVIGGPNKPRSLDSFLFPGLYHLAALQIEGLRIWDAAEQRRFTTRIFLFLVTADSPAMAYISGLVGHNGAHGCRLYCPQVGRHKPNHPTYYPALKRPRGDDDGPPDMTLRIETSFDSSATQARYEANLALVRNAKSKSDYAHARLVTGIAKPSLFSGLPRFLGVPGGFALDLMHLVSLNLTDLVVSLLRGTLACDFPDDKSTWDFAIFADQALWKVHGQLVADATRYLPGSFDRPPRDPAKKISSGYKAWEYLLYVYGLLPGLLRHILPEKYYRHFCRLVFGVRFVLQYKLLVPHLPAAHKSLVKYHEEYENIYYCRRIERLHFVRPSLHTLGHVIPEASRVGPGALHTQWTMENYIGNITREIKQHVTPYANVSERALRRCQVNALKAMYPDFADPDDSPPQTAMAVGGGYFLLRARDSIERPVTPFEGQALHGFLSRQRVHLANPLWDPVVRRWARLRLPNGQIARCAWKECALEARGRKPRRARMVKLRDNRFAEVQYFFPMRINDRDEVLAMVALFSPPNQNILVYSRSTLIACNYLGNTSRLVVFVKDIVSVVAMVPLPMSAEEACEVGADIVYGRRFFVVEKPGLDIAIIAGRVEDAHIDADGLDSDV